MGQKIHFCAAKDGTSIAYGITGSGYPVVRAAHYLSHLSFDFESPVWSHWIRELSKDNMYVRYDERGCGLSDWNPTEFSFEAWVSDLETVVDSIGLDKFNLLGISQGGSVGVAYAARHPERVSRLVLYGSYALGWARRRQNPQDLARREAMNKLIDLGWGKDNPAFRQMFTSLFIPEAGLEQIRWFNELQRVSCTPENALKFDSVFANIDVTKLLPKITAPTLILNAREDSVVPFEQGKLLASQIKGARFVPLEGRNHILLETEPGWKTFLQELRQFIGIPRHTQISSESGIALPTEDELLAIRDQLVRMNDISLSKFRVVGDYVRHDAQVRNSLKDWKQKIIVGLQTQSAGTRNYLVWALPGSGKSYFVQEIAKSLEGVVHYEEFNLALLDRDEFRSGLLRVGMLGKPCLCLVDEIDAKPIESWPYELLLPSLDPPSSRTSPVSFVLAGSSTSGKNEMKKRIASRPKGSDLLSRIPAANELEIPIMNPGDKILVTLVQLMRAGEKLGKTVGEVEKFALFYVCANPRLSSARQLRDFALQCVERSSPGEDRIKYDHMFSPGDTEQGFLDSDRFDERRACRHLRVNDQLVGDTARSIEKALSPFSRK